MTRLLLILSALAMTLLLNLPGAHAQALWTDGFESGTYNGPWGRSPTTGRL